MIDSGATLARRLERYRAATGTANAPGTGPPVVAGGTELAERLAAAIDGEVVVTAEGTIVRCEPPTRLIPVDRERLAPLPGQPEPDVPLVCLDTETTGLATAAGTVAFLIGLGWWEAERFRQVQLVLPDHAEERALLTALASAIPAAAWLVTYNGRGFDWPLLVARYRLARRPAPVHAGHLDLLPIVRRLFRHRMPDARLRTAEAELLGLHRIGDVDGGEIPGRYFDYLRGGPAEGLVDVIRHNDQDVRSLARLLGHLETRLGDRECRAVAPTGDLAGLARAFARERRLGEALECLDVATTRSLDGSRAAPQSRPQSRADTVARPIGPRIPLGVRPDDDPWWSPRRPADFGGPPGRAIQGVTPSRTAQLDAPWTAERIAADRAHLLRRLGRYVEAVEAWDALTAGPGRMAIVAMIEQAKLHEHRLRDRPAALAATVRGLGHVERRRQLGRPEPALEANLRRRMARLRRHHGKTDRRSVA